MTSKDPAKDFFLDFGSAGTAAEAERAGVSSIPYAPIRPLLNYQEFLQSILAVVAKRIVGQCTGTAQDA